MPKVDRKAAPRRDPFATRQMTCGSFRKAARPRMWKRESLVGCPTNTQAAPASGEDLRWEAKAKPSVASALPAQQASRIRVTIKTWYKNGEPKAMLQQIERRIPATFSGYNCPLLTFIFPGFDCGSKANPWDPRSLVGLGRSAQLSTDHVPQEKVSPPKKKRE